jgi:hypothetical protein
MSHWLDSTLQHLQLGEALIAGGVDGLYHAWQASADALGELCTGTEDRWHAVIRQIQTPVNFAEILRARSLT